MDKNIVSQTQNVNKPLHCFECGAPVDGVSCYLEFLSPQAIPNNVDPWGKYIWYLKLSDSCRDAGHRSRVIRLGDVIAQLGAREKAVTVEQIREELAQLAALPESQSSKPDPTERIVYQLVAGQITPDAAIAEIRELVRLGVVGALLPGGAEGWEECQLCGVHHDPLERCQGFERDPAEWAWER